MTPIERASALFEVSLNSLKQFKAVDPFNLHVLEGCLVACDRFYGSMLITAIDEQPTEQVVIGTPKQRYPFDKKGRFLFPETSHINIYEKLDGTNILAYSYETNGELHVTYKTRLTPILQESRWGNFYQLWNSLLTDEMEWSIKALVTKWRINLSFELYGKLNTHLIEYDVPLSYKLLFGIKNSVSNSQIIEPINLPNKKWAESISCLQPILTLTKNSNLPEEYNRLRLEQEEKNHKVEGEHTIEGSEGFVWYLTDRYNVTRQYKCKPPSVEEIHWAGGLSKNTVLATVMNAYENSMNPEYEDVKRLLLEEFKEGVIELQHSMIMDCLSIVRKKLELEEHIMYEYNAIENVSSLSSPDVMRKLSPKFKREEMKKVYTILKIRGLV